MRLGRKLRLVLCLIRARVRVREAMRAGFEGTQRVRCTIRVVLGLYVILMYQMICIRVVLLNVTS